MKKLLVLALSMLPLAFLASCEQTEKPAIEPEPIKPVEYTLSISPDAPIKFTEVGGVSTITVTTNHATWDVKTSHPWCEVAKASDGKSFTVTAKVAAETKDLPEATVTVTATTEKVTKTAMLMVNQSGKAVDPFAVTVTEIKDSSARVNVVPVDKKLRYYYDIVKKADVDTDYSGSVGDFIDEFVAFVIKMNSGNIDKTLNSMCYIGDKSYNFPRLKPNTDYIAFAVALGDDAKIASKIITQDFKTPGNAAAIGETIHITLDKNRDNHLRVMRNQER